MPSLLIFSTSDIGQNYRLLRHAKSFSLLKNAHVTIFAPDISSLPKEIEKAENISSHYLYVFRLPYFFNFIFFPIQYFLVQIQCYIFVAKSLFYYDFIISNPWPLLDSIFSLSLSRMIHAKLIYDISIFRFADKTRSQIVRNIEKKVNRIADFRICSTRALQVFLELQKLSSSIVHDPPGTQFYSQKVIKEQIFSFLDISERYLIAVLIPMYDNDFLNAILDNCAKLDEKEVKSAFIIFGNPKIQLSLESAINKKSNFPQNLKKSINFPSTSNLNLKYSSIHYVPINTDAYANILSCCDLGILSNGSRYGFDYSPELTELIACGIPTIVRKGGCMKEVIENGKNGFIINSLDQLYEILSNILVEKNIDLNLMKESMKSHCSNWDTEWKNFFDPLLEKIKY